MAVDSVAHHPILSRAHAALTPPPSRGRRRALGTLAVLLFAGSAAWMAEERTPWRQWVADRRTGIGERTGVTLADGSRIELNSDTAIDIRFTDAERLLRLVRGEILLDTAPDPTAGDGKAARPFIVQTAQGHIHALGTRFMVRQPEGWPGGESVVAVFDGAVALQPRNAKLRVLGAGQQASFTRDGVGPITTAREEATAWTRGMIVARDMPLADFLAELDRHHHGHLGCDPAVAGLEVTGTYPLADPDGVLDMLQTTLPVRLRSRRRWWGPTELTLVAR
jgi:transmembrane sensor